MAEKVISSQSWQLFHLHSVHRKAGHSMSPFPIATHQMTYTEDKENHVLHAKHWHYCTLHHSALLAKYVEK